VTGTVLDADGAPVANTALRVGAALTTTDADGHFAVPDVADEYDVTVARPLRAVVFSFQGLRRRDPTLWLFESAPAPLLPLSATVHVRATLADDERLLVFADTDGASASDAPSLHAVNAVGGVDARVAWRGASGRDVALRALRYVVSAGSTFADRYTGVAAATVHVNDAGEATGTAEAFEPVGTKTVTTQVATSNDVDVKDAVLTMQLGADGALVTLPAPSPSASETTDLVPDLPGASFVLAAYGGPKDNAGSPAINGAYATSRVTDRAASGGRLAIRLPDLVSLAAPAADAVDLTTDTEFTWAPLADGVHPLVRFEGDFMTPVVAPTVYVQTARASVRFPDATDLGVRYPAGAKYEWEVLAASWMPEPGTGGLTAESDAEQRLSVSEARAFDLAGTR
jgi:hypothetical protein